jgi:adenylate cyclase
MTARILVVDDEPDVEALVLQKFRHQIRDGAITFFFARDGVEALAAFRKNDGIDLVVTDINMPRMDGLTLLQKLQEGEESVSTIVVSAYGDMANIRTAMNRGAFDFVTKPIDFLDLEMTITKTLRHIEFLRDARQRQAEAERAHASLSRYFSPNLAQRLVSDCDAIDLRGQRREIATLFTDITSFTALVETLEPDVLGPLLNQYLTGMTDVVFAHDGTVAKIVGDALHVLFGAPGEQPDHAARAVACALTLDEYAEVFRERCREKGVALGTTRTFTPVLRLSGTSVAVAFSTTRRMATRSTLPLVSKRPTSNSARGFASARLLRRKSQSFLVVPWAILCSVAKPRHCECPNLSARSKPMIRGQRAI